MLLAKGDQVFSLKTNKKYWKDMREFCQSGKVENFACSLATVP